MDLGRVQARLGRREEARQTLAELERLGREGYAAPFQTAVIHATLGELDSAFAALEQAFSARSWYLTWLRADPFLDPLRADPRFARLERRVGFPP
jgi:hypothetical protein